MINIFTKIIAETAKNSTNSSAVFLICLNKEGQVINKKEVGDLIPSYTYGNRVSITNVHRMINSPRDEFHAYDEDLGGDGIPLFNTSSRVEKLILPSLTKIEMKEEEMKI